MKIVLLSPNFKEVPRLEHLDHHGPRYGHWKFGISISFNYPNTLNISKCSKSGFPSLFMAVLKNVRGSISRCFQHENHSLKSPISFGSNNTSIDWPQLKISSFKVMTLGCWFGFILSENFVKYLIISSNPLCAYFSWSCQLHFDLTST